MVLLSGVEIAPADYRAFKCSRLVKDLRLSEYIDKGHC
ncbi:hypothetical protein Krodi_1177 [Dokdonia sp. 4H-3-7-5]|nr:hypothetical protein Krodi_1177 [Dokdonia sp. 4H-3-7-5]